MFVIVIYDVPAERTRVYRKLLRRQLEHIQYSVFVGDVTNGQFTGLKNEIRGELEPDDSVVVFEAEQAAAVEYTTFGDADEPGSQFT